MPIATQAKPQTTVALSKEARDKLEAALSKRGSSMAGYFSNKAGGRFLSEDVVGAAAGKAEPWLAARAGELAHRKAVNRGEVYVSPPYFASSVQAEGASMVSGTEDPFGYIPRKTFRGGVSHIQSGRRPGYADTFMRLAGATAEAQAMYDLDLALNLFSTPDERDRLSAEARLNAAMMASEAERAGGGSAGYGVSTAGAIFGRLFGRSAGTAGKSTGAAARRRATDVERKRNEAEDAAVLRDLGLFKGAL